MRAPARARCVSSLLFGRARRGGCAWEKRLRTSPGRARDTSGTCPLPFLLGAPEGGEEEEAAHRRGSWQWGTGRRGEPRGPQSRTSGATNGISARAAVKRDCWASPVPCDLCDVTQTRARPPNRPSPLCPGRAPPIRRAGCAGYSAFGINGVAQNDGNEVPNPRPRFQTLARTGTNLGTHWNKPGHALEQTLACTGTNLGTHWNNGSGRVPAASSDPAPQLRTKL
eukprot:gene16342-biopygen2240